MADTGAPAPAPAPAATETARLGLQVPIAAGSKRGKRRSAPKREGKVWATVDVVSEHDTTPGVKHLPLVQQAPAARCRSGPPRARAASVRLGGGAQLVRLRQDQERATQPPRPRGRRQARLLSRLEALHLKEKLQSAAYEQEAVKWDTDSDSDMSDDEEDLKV